MDATKNQSEYEASRMWETLLAALPRLKKARTENPTAEAQLPPASGLVPGLR